MDLNLLYARHQRAIMQTAQTLCRTAHAGHIASANGVARTIRSYQAAQGASAAKGWHDAVAAKPAVPGAAA